MFDRAAVFTAALVGLQLALGSLAPRTAAQTCVTDTVTADFAAGDLGSCYAGERADGEVLLTPTEGSEFSGVALPPGWALFDWHPPNGATNTVVGGGVVNVDNARINPADPAAYGFGRSLEFVATFRPETFQHSGFGGGTHATIYDTDTRAAAFTTLNQTSSLYARVDDGSSSVDTVVAAIDSLPHRYRIDWSENQVDFYIDGVFVHTDVITIAGTMRPAFSDFGSAADFLTVDWLRMTPYASPCVFDSRIFDGGNDGADWSDLDASTVLPGGTGITIETRSGNTPTPDPSWSLFQLLSGTTIESPSARYLQYRATLSTGDADQTPQLEDAEVCYEACVPSGAEICDGNDNDCNGQIDEGTDGTPCNTGQPGICADSTSVCNAGVLECPQVIFPATETCNNLDDDCDNSVDEGTGGAPCNTGEPGVCAAGIEVCSGGMLQCPQTIFPTPESCNSLDDDCDGPVDEDNPGGGGGCTTGQPGICSPGTLQCSSGSLGCEPNASATTEVCNNLDDDCDGSTDEDTGGAVCVTGQPGVCGPGTQQCQSGTLNCVPNTPSSTELCETGQDEDCNGETDEAGCACAMAETVLSTTQTKLNKVRLSDKSDRDKVLAKGTFILPMAGVIDPATQVVRFRITDSQGLHYEGTIPASNFVASSSGRTFKFSDPTLAHDGIKSAKLSIGRDDLTVKYLFKAQELNQPAFTAGTGTATVIIGTRCFKDTADTCTLSASESSAKCR